MEEWSQNVHNIKIIQIETSIVGFVISKLKCKIVAAILKEKNDNPFNVTERDDTIVSTAIL